MTGRLPKDLIIAIVGATGTGKSQLAVTLAERFHGEIINGDALQLYNGLPIITNKIPLHERKGIPHHLLGCVELDDEPWTVGRFTEEAHKTIKEIRSRGKLPILAGGTHYYTQALLFHDALLQDGASRKLSREQQEYHWPILESNTETLLEELQKVDPRMAARWHPRDRRKIRRSLEVWLTTGKKASEIYDEQNLHRHGNSITKNSLESHESADATQEIVASKCLRFPAIIFWLHASEDVLQARLKERVIAMISNGLLHEVELMQGLLRRLEARGLTVDQTRGIWVAIGYKEFLPYIHALEDDKAEMERLEQLKQIAIEKTVIATRQYSKRQIRWIRLRLLQALTEAKSKESLFLLDATDLSQWATNVENIAVNTTSAFLSDSDLPKPTDISELAQTLLSATRSDNSGKSKEHSARYCDSCHATLMSEPEWTLHVKGKKHRKVLKGLTRRPPLDCSNVERF